MTNKIYPKLEIRGSTLKDKVHIKASTWVRVKRGSTRYLVYVEDSRVKEVIVKDEIFSPTPKEVIFWYKNFSDSFTTKCLLTKYLWREPKDITVPPYVNMHGEPVVKIDDNHLSDKEQFLVEFNHID